MHIKFLLAIVLLTFLHGKNIIGQCSNDSVVIHKYHEYNSNNNLFVDSIVYTSFNLDSGFATANYIVSTNHSFWTAPAQTTYLYEKTDSILNPNGSLAEWINSVGNGSGWDLDFANRFTYNNNGQMTSRTEMKWNGSSWDSMYIETWTYDSFNRLTNSESYTNQSGWIKGLKTDIIYINGHPNTKTLSRGDANNAWDDYQIYSYAYTNSLRTSVEIFKQDISGNMVSSGVYNYLLSQNNWVIKIQEITAKTISSVTVYDTLNQELDTLENILYQNRWQFSTLSSAYFNEDAYAIINSVITQTYHNSSNMVNWIVPPNWDVLDRTYQLQYSYDSVPQLIHYTESGACTNPCGSVVDYSYDSYGRLTHDWNDWSSMVADHNVHHDWIYLDSSDIKIIIPENENNIHICANTTYQTTILVAGGCQPNHFRWLPSTGLSTDTIINPIITITDSITYTIIAYDDYGNTDTAFYTLKPFIKPQHVAIDSLYCDGRALLSVQLPYSSYKWHFNTDANIVGYTRQILGNNSGDYWCTITDNISWPYAMTCSLNSDTISINPQPAPTIYYSPDTIYCSATGNSFSWYRYGTFVATTVDPFLVINQSGDYHVIVTDSTGCTTSSATINASLTAVHEIAENYFTISNLNQDQIQIKRNISSGTYNVCLRDVTGRTLFQASTYQVNYILDLSLFPGGIYIVDIKDKEIQFSKTIFRK